jgi:hypothetical protein
MSDVHPSQVPKHTNAEIETALLEAEGNVAAAARALEMRRTHLKEKIDKSAYLTTVLNDLREELLDTAEDNKFKAVRAGDQQASSFVLMTLGKNRGYSQRLEATGKNGERLNGPGTLVVRGYTEEEVIEIKRLRDAEEQGDTPFDPATEPYFGDEE